VLRAIQIGVRNRIAPKEANAKSAVKPILDFALTVKTSSRKKNFFELFLIDIESGRCCSPRVDVSQGIVAANGPRRSIFCRHHLPQDAVSALQN